ALATADGVWFLGTETVVGGHPIYRIANGKLLLMAGGAITLGMIDGALYHLNDANLVFRWNTAGGDRRGSVTPSDNSTWFLGDANVTGGHPVYRFANGQLTKMPGGAVTLGTIDGT